MSNFNYLTNSLEALQRFGGNVGEQVRNSIYQSQYGFGSKEGSILSKLPSVIKTPAKAAGTTIADVLTNQTLAQGWKYTNPMRMAGQAAKTAAGNMGIDPITGATLAFAAPIALAALSNVRGPLSEGLRPKGYKAVAPVSKEEDPSGATPKSKLLEATLRYGLGQRSQMLPYQEFKKERPDIDPLTYKQYRRYETSKPPAGSLFSIDPEGQSFTTVGGLVRGSAKGLNDPEVRIKGFPVTLSGVLGTAALLSTAGALYSNLPKKVKEARVTQGVPYGSEIKSERLDIQRRLDPLLKKQNQLSAIVNRVSAEMSAKGVPSIGSVSPIDQKEALKVARQLANNADKLAKYEYAHGRATGKIPDPTEARINASSNRLDELAQNTSIPETIIEKAKAFVNENIMKQKVQNKEQAELRDAMGVEKMVSFSSSKENIEQLETNIAYLKRNREQLIQNQKEKLSSLASATQDPEARSLQDRLSRASRKLGEVKSEASDLNAELRSTYRPVTVKVPTTATVAGIALAGTAAAIGTAAVVKKLMQKSSESRLKKENPVEYLKYKHGSLQAAAQALGQPQASSWNELTPYVK